MINQPIEEKWEEEFEKFIRHPITQKKNEPRMFFSVILADDVKSFIENLLEQERSRISDEIIKAIGASKLGILKNKTTLEVLKDILSIINPSKE